MRQYIGWIIVGTFVLYLLSILAPFMLAIPTLLAWLVPLLMWRNLGKGACKQASLLVIIGCTALFFSAHQGVFLGWKQIFAANLPLLAMFVAVSFLAMTNTGIEDHSLPKGKSAVIITAVGTHLLGAIINLSVLFVFGDRLQKKGILTRTQMIILARSFCSAAWWSPFFIATGVALTYAPGMSWQKTFVSSQFTLFLAAGVFSTGIKSITHVYPALFSLEGTAFTPVLFSVVLGLMIGIGIMGVHPVVSIAIVSPLLLPLNLDHSQLGFLFLSSWSISTACGPLSGVGLALVSRYQASPRGIIQSNWHYAIAMWAIVSAVNIFFF
ncbi:hypothetical protein [Desulfobacula sp.]|uniref:hypothetical protein n=1 Tax=Desulfobacula sp. TaxID=2593537 RepID=UPI001EB8DA03|nr:hypothetical protein [Desulfobacula sp.]